MKVLPYKDWKQRICFDNVMYKDVKRYSLLLNTMEREIMEEQISFYRHNFSLLQVMNYLKQLKKIEDIENFIRMILKRQDNILYMPDIMLEYFRKKIKKEFPDYEGFLNILLEKANSQSPRNPMINIIKKIFGYYYKDVLKEIKQYSKKEDFRPIQRPLKREGIENFARDQIAKLQNDVLLGTVFGRCTTNKRVAISIVDEYGYGEWISKNVSYNTNRFFIYSNNSKLTTTELEHMVYFNVYPGLAHMYDIVPRPENRIKFDNGATYFINGWGMYAMCRCRNSAYSTSLLIESSTIAKYLLKGNLAKAYEAIYVYLLGKYPKQKAMDYMLDYTCYPGHYLSYVLGGIGFHQLMLKNFAKTPEDLIKSLSQINCGDCFAIYHPKVQKKIAKTSITARVVPQYTDF